MRSTWFFASAALLASLATSVRGAETQIFDETTTVTTKVDGRPVEVTVTTISPRAEYVAKESWRWGAEGSLPKVAIKNLSVIVGSRPIFVPVSAFFDLGNPSHIAVKKAKNGFRIEIRGGDAATSYKAELSFAGGVLRRRKVLHGEFPREAWEESVYSFNF